MPHIDRDPFTFFPRPADVHRRLGELARERRLMRRLLRLALAAHEEHANREDLLPEEQEAPQAR
jgi:hypothetical protein